MQRFSRWLVAMAALTCGLAGCTDQQAQREAEAREEFLQIIDLVNQAEVGFKPENHPAESLRAYRLQKLDEAERQLESVLRSGSNDQKREAYAVLADVHAAKARDVMNQAKNAWAELANRSAVDIGQLININSAAMRTAISDVKDSEQERAILRIQEQARAELADQRAALGELNERIDAMERERDGLRDRARSVFAEARTLRDNGLRLDGEERYDTLDQAAKLEESSIDIAAEAQAVEARLSLLLSERTVIEESIRSREAYLTTLSEQLDVIENRQAEIDQTRSESRERMRELSDRLTTSLDDLLQAYHQEVAAAYSEAAEHLRQAVEASNSALGLSRGAQAATAEFSLLTAQLDLIHALTAHTVSAGDLGGPFVVIDEGSERLMPDHQTRIQTMLGEIRASQNTVAGEALSVIEEAAERASSLAGGGTAASEDAASLTASLSAYRDRIEQSRLQ